ncbi:jacalin-like lectin [Micromonospora sp. NBC_01813]|uniref:jacalin-like lectin n=1 Tax=Micromonospora sp. NBC_01813 TaxID=2975988 RepID=UPI002DD90A90|nr:jacalin-like lectin [Micromonospora sp. NBC_01813]WSA09889.1 jacalin-like lectin [Micromonospora sp. NBC_01813]
MRKPASATGTWLPVGLVATLAITVGLVAGPGARPAAASATSGTVSVLTYNVAGLPAWLSSGNPAVNTRPIGQRVGGYDVVHVQEDFNYHADLYAANSHPHRTPTSGGVPFGDGLNTLSYHPYSDLTRVRWNTCNGTDCLTPKGFTRTRIRLADGVHVDFYNAHPNAGSTDADLAARRANISQLTAYVLANSAGNAVVVAGDTNTRWTRAGDNIRDLASAAGLTDAWVQGQRDGVPPAAGSPALVCDPAQVTDACEVVDKILYRGNRLIDLDLLRYANDNADFLDAAGAPLSDHYPITATLRWSLADDLRMSDDWGGPHGTPFTDVDQVRPGAQVSRLTVRGGARLDQVSLAVADGPVLSHGGTGGSPASLDLTAGERLTQVTLTRGQRDGRTRVFSARFVTSRGRVLAAGTPTADAVTFTAPAGWQIGGFHGRGGAELDRLGVIYTPAP